MTNNDLMTIKIDYYDVFLRIKDKRIRENVQDLSLRLIGEGKKQQSIEIRIKSSQGCDVFISNNIEIIDDDVTEGKDLKDSERLSLKLWINNYKCSLHILGSSNLESKFNDVKCFIINGNKLNHDPNANIATNVSPLTKCTKRGYGVNSNILKSGLTPNLKMKKPITKSPTYIKSPFKTNIQTSEIDIFHSPNHNKETNKSGFTKHVFLKIPTGNLSNSFKECSIKKNEMIWTDVQQKIINSCTQGKNIFFTGGAGTGKTTLLTYLINLFIQIYGKSSVFVAATTGLAACAIGGTTIYQFAGITCILEDFEDPKLMKLQHDRIVKDTCSNPQVRKRCREAKVLLIDEVSMMNSPLIELLNSITQVTRGNSNQPMGGIQIVLTGDFYQLPPVVNVNAFQKSNNAAIISNNINNNVSNNNNNNKTNKTSLRFCFQSPLWSKLINESFELQQVYRQRNISNPNDKISNEFISVLNKIRIGNYDDSCKALLDQCIGRKLDNHDGILPTQIFTHKKNVDQLNYQKLVELPGKVKTYHAIDSGKDIYINMLKNHCRARSKIELKVGAQVILVKTTSALEGLVNGARGTVIEFDSENRPIVRFTDGIERTIRNEIFPVVLGGIIVAERLQLPLDLCWAISVHKSQGMTVDKAILDLKHSFEYGQVYVALSRVRCIEGLSLLYPLQINNIKAHPDVIKFYQECFKNKKDMNKQILQE